MGRRRTLLLLSLTTVPAAVEAIILRVFDFESAYPLSPQVAAPPPFGIFHDMRWVFVYHNSWAGMAGEMIAAIVFRSFINSAIVRAAWPWATDPRRSWPSLLRTNLIFNSIIFVTLSPWAVVAIAASETSLSWFVFGEVLPIALLALVLQRGGIDANWWRALPSWRAIGWTLVTFAIICLDAMVIGFAPGWWSVPVAAGAGVVNAWLWLRLVSAVVTRPPALAWTARVPVAPLAIVVALGGLVGLGQLAPIGSAEAARPEPPIRADGADQVKQAVIYVAGYDSTYRPAGDGSTDGLMVTHFSYRGLDSAGQPLPYDALTTHQSLGTSARHLAEQVEVVHGRTGRPVALIGQSEGTLVVRTYLDTLPHPHVDAAVALSPLVQPGRVYYPPADATGWGIAAGWELRAMLAVIRDTSGSQVRADEPFVRSVLDGAVLYRNRMLCPVPGVRMIAFLPTASAAVAPSGTYAQIPVVEQVGLHASLLGRPDVQQHVVDFLNNRSAGSAPGLYYPVIQRMAAAWQAPALALGVNPVWPSAGQPDASFGQDGCQAHPPWTRS